MAQNKVIAGDYIGASVSETLGTVTVGNITFSKHTAESYEVITEEQRKSAVSGVLRGLVGRAVLGPVGLLAGLSAKNVGTYTIAVNWKIGKKIRIEVNDK
ncbi:MAG: hypothetical protein K2H90_03120, partial [Oscillospiraceae bacterium]|nr:hypothetical protein [Oscillospiraceae bacterium]